MSLLPSWAEREAEEREEVKSKNVCNFRRFINSRVALHSFGTIVLLYLPVDVRDPRVSLSKTCHV